MKTTNLNLLLTIAIISIGTLSCRKENLTSPGNGGGSTSSISNVTSSSWFSADWHTGVIMEFVKDVPGLTDDFLKDGKGLVFGKGGFEMRDPTALPSTFDANYITSKPEAGDIKFILQGGGAISSSLVFRYILIPVTKLVSDHSLDYRDYHAVCAYYKIAE